MEINLIIFILLIHWLADSSLQTNQQAITKWRDNKMLAYHVFTYSLVWLVVAFVLSNSLTTALAFFLITFIAHFATDYVTSKITHELFERKDTHDGFVVVLGDQVLHYIQLLLTFKLLIL